MVPVGKDNPQAWQWNGNREKPTITPSLLNRHVDHDTEIPFVCHLFVTDGMVQYLGDCTHKLAGQTVPIKNLEYEE